MTGCPKKSERCTSSPAAVYTVKSRSQTYAFTALGMSQLFHAIGMRDVECSIFKMKHFSNKLMMAAFSIGLALQLAVTTIPYFTNAFGTCLLQFSDWKFLLLLSALLHSVGLFYL